MQHKYPNCYIATLLSTTSSMVGLNGIEMVKSASEQIKYIAALSIKNNSMYECNNLGTSISKCKPLILRLYNYK